MTALRRFRAWQKVRGQNRQAGESHHAKAAESFQSVPLAITWAVAYVIAAASEVSAIKALNYEVNVWLPLYSAFMLNEVNDARYWVAVTPLNASQTSATETPGKSLKAKLPESWFEVPSYALGTYATATDMPLRAYLGAQLQTRFGVYMSMGVLTYFITLSRNLSVNNIPGSVFTLLLSTSIVFNMILSKLWLKRKFNAWHLAAGLLCFGAAAAVGVTSIYNQIKKGDKVSQGENFLVGVPSALAAAFSVALMSVYSERTKPLMSDRDFRLLEMTIVASIVAACILAPTILASGEYKSWKPELDAAYRHTPTLLIIVSIALPFIKAIVRSGKYATIAYSSAFFFEFVQACGSLLGSLANVYLFNEPWTSGFVAALVLMTLSFAAYLKAKAVDLNAAKTSAATPALESVTSLNGAVAPTENAPLLLRTNAGGDEDDDQSQPSEPSPFATPKFARVVGNA